MVSVFTVGMKKEYAHPVRVHLGLDPVAAHPRRITAGVSDYARALPHRWHLTRDYYTAIKDLALLNVRGIITQAFDDDIQEQVQRLGLARVQVGSVFDPGRLPFVLPDNHAIGAMAADYFLSLGFRTFAYFGPKNHWYALHREQGFVARLSDRSVDVHHAVNKQTAASKQWLAKLRQGTALFCANDIFARTAALHLVQLGRRIPEDVAILGVDNDEAENAMSPVPISSIDPRSREIGHAAAALLDDLMQGRKPTVRQKFIAPAGVIGRRSTELIAVEDRHVAEALALIRDRACNGLDVSQLLAHIPLSRRSLERRFQTILGRGIDSEIRRVRMERAKELLSRTDLSVAEVATRAGYGDIYYFSSAFRKAFGHTPSNWRKENRAR